MRADELRIEKELFIGKSKKNLRRISVIASNFRIESDGVYFQTEVPDYDWGKPRERDAWDVFDAMVIVIGYFLSKIKEELSNDPSLSLYAKFEGELEKVALEDVFKMLISR